MFGHCQHSEIAPLVQCVHISIVISKKNMQCRIAYSAQCLLTSAVHLHTYDITYQYTVTSPLLCSLSLVIVPNKQCLLSTGVTLFRDANCFALFLYDEKKNNFAL